MMHLFCPFQFDFLRYTELLLEKNESAYKFSLVQLQDKSDVKICTSVPLSVAGWAESKITTTEPQQNKPMKQEAADSCVS